MASPFFDDEDSNPYLSGDAYSRLGVSSSGPPVTLAEALAAQKLAADRAIAEDDSQKSAFGSGLKSGYESAIGLGGQGLEALGKATGIQSLQDYGASVAQKRFEAAQQAQRSDMQKYPWEEGGPGVVPWLANLTGQALPYAGAAIAAGALTPEAAVPAGLARLSTMLPRFLGGGGTLGRAGLPFAERMAAGRAGQDFARNLVGGMAVGAPIGAGSIYGEMKEAAGDEEPSRAQALGALALGVPYAALEAVAPAQIAGLAKRGLSSGNFLKRAATAGLASAAEQGIQEGAQRFMEVSVRPDMTLGEKAKSIVENAVAGAGVGAVLGSSIGGIRRLQSANPSNITKDDLKQSVDTDLNFGQPTNNAQQLPLNNVPQEQSAPDLVSQATTPQYQEIRKRIDSGELSPNEPLNQEFIRAAEKEDAQLKVRVIQDLERRLMQGEPIPNGLQTLEMLRGELASRGQEGLLVQQRQMAENFMRTGQPNAAPVPQEQQQDFGFQQAAPYQTSMAEVPQQEFSTDFLRGAKTESIANYIMKKEALIDEGKAQPEDSLIVDQLKRVLAERQQEEQITARQGVLETMNKASELVGDVKGAKQSIFKLQARDEIELAEKIQQALDNGSTNQTYLNLADAYQLGDPNSKMSQAIAERQGIRQAEGTQANFNFYDETPPQSAPPAPTELPPQAPVNTQPSTTPGEPDAVQERGPTEIPVQPTADFSGEVGQGVPQPGQAPIASAPVQTTGPVTKERLKAAQEKIKIASEPINDVKAAPVERLQIRQEFLTKAREAVAQKIQEKEQLGQQKIEQIKTQQAAGKFTAKEAATQISQVEKAVKKEQDRLFNEYSEQYNLTEAQSIKDELAARETAPAQMEQTSQTNQTEDNLDSTAFDRFLQRATTEKLQKNAEFNRTQLKAAQDRLKSYTDSVTKQIESIKEKLAAGKISAKAAKAKIKQVETQSNAKVADFINRNIRPFSERVDAIENELTNREKASSTQTSKPKTSKPDSKSESGVEWIDKAPKNKFFNLPGVVKVLQQWMKLLGMADQKLKIMSHNDLRVYVAEQRKKGITVSPDIDQLVAGMDANRMLGAAIPGGKAYLIILNANYLPTSLKDAPLKIKQAFEILAHEIGHMHQEYVFDKLSPEEKQKLFDAYEADKARVKKDKSYGAYLKTFVPYEMAKQFSSGFNSRVLSTSLKDITLKSSKELEKYDLSFEEWFAHQVARAATLHADMRGFVKQEAAKEKANGFVENFFAKLVRNLQALFKAAKEAGYLPNTTFQQYIADLNQMTINRGDFVPTSSRPFNALRNPLPFKNTQELLDNAPQVVKSIDMFYRGYLKPNIKNQLLHFSTLGNIREWGRFYFGKALDKLYPATEDYSVIESRISKLALVAYNKLVEFERKNPKSNVVKLIGRLMEATNFQLNPDKPFDAHTWLKNAPNKDNLRKIHEEMVKIKNQLRQMKAYDIYEDMDAGNQMIFYAPQVLAVYNIIQLDPNAKAYFSSMKNPWEEFTNDAASQKSVVAARDFWKTKSQEFYDKGNAYLKSIENQKDNKASKRILSGLSAQLAEMKRGGENLNKFPYFHLGRFGNWEVRFTVRKDGDIADPKALERIAEILDENGFGGLAVVSPDQTNPAVYIRLENEAQKENLMALAKQKMTAEKLLDPNKPVTGGPRGTESQFGTIKKGAIDELIKFLQSNLDSQELTDLTDAQRAAVAENEKRTIADIVSFYRDSLSEFSQERVLLRRKYVGGYSPDMVRSYAYRYRVAAQTIAHMVTMPRINEAFVDMRAQLRAAQADPKDVRGERAADMARIYNELLLREKLRPSRFRPSWIDRLRAYNHIYFLGLSPAYAMINLSQIPVLLWPELAKDGRVSFKKSAQTIFRVTPMAFKILRAAMQQEKSRGRGAEVVLSVEALEAAGLDPETTKFMIQMINTNSLDIGGASREHSQIVEGDINSKERKLLQWTGAFGYYSEAFNRIVAALAAKEVYNPKNVQNLTREEFARNVVRNSMLQYSEWNVARALGRNGIVGEATKLSATFMQYPAQVLERLTREMYVAFANDPSLSPEQQKEVQKGARRFLAAHTTAILAFAGVVGLPFAGAVARAVEALADIFGDDDEPYDVMKSLNDFFSDVFGEDVAPYIMRGAIPRLLGTDIAERAGEGDLLPFTKFMRDRRDWTEKMKDFAAESFGAPYSMATNIAQGGQKLMAGDWVGAGEQALPIAFRSLVKAGRYMSEGQYTDRSGNALPMTPGATAILNQALGFKPAERSDYDVQNRSDTVRRTVMERDATNLRKDFYQAFESGDSAGARTALQNIKDWDQRNPAYAIFPSLEKSLVQRAKARLYSEKFNAPLNTSRRELEYYYLPKLMRQEP